MSPMLREMLLAWRVRCPRKDGELHRVFPAPGAPRAWPLPREGGGGPLVYGSFRKRYWAPALTPIRSCQRSTGTWLVMMSEPLS